MTILRPGIFKFIIICIEDKISFIFIDHLLKSLKDKENCTPHKLPTYGKMNTQQIRKFNRDTM